MLITCQRRLQPLPLFLHTTSVNNGTMAESSGKELAREAKKERKVSFGSTHRFSYETADRLKQQERDFVLDGVCLSHLANDETDRTFPSLNIGIPQYRVLADKDAQGYFKRRGLPKFSREDSDQSSMQGQVLDHFSASSKAKAYLKDKEKDGGGYTRQLWGGHTSVPTDPTVTGWHGTEGYRRNTFDLRARRSVFDYEDPFEKQAQHRTPRQRTQSAPATMRILRQKSASAYRSYPGGNRRAMSAMPRPQTGHMTRPLATGPVS